MEHGFSDADTENESSTEASRATDYDGLQDRVRTMELPAIDVFQNKYSDREYAVEHEFTEFTCVCPKTGLPDFATVTIRYTPGEKCVELKSLKLYLIAFRDVGIFHEHAVNRILDDFVRATRPGHATVEGEFNIRGGLGTKVEASYPAPEPRAAAT